MGWLEVYVSQELLYWERTVEQKPKVHHGRPFEAFRVEI